MKDKKENPHAGHRQRMRDKFLAEGSFDNFAPHNILEMMLFYSSPRSDTNELAHALIDNFGSIKNVLDAPYETLINIKGVGQQTAVLIKLIQSLVKKYNYQETANIKHVKTTTEAVNYLRPMFCNKTTEYVAMLCINHSGKLIKTSVISNGSIDSTQLDLRKLIFEALSCHATKIILAHNHPGGICIPSLADIEATKAVAKALSNLKIAFVDHIIIADDGEFFSFSETQSTKNLLITEQTDAHIATIDDDEVQEAEHAWTD